MKRYKLYLFVVLLTFLTLLVGCETKNDKPQKVKDLEFTVVEEADIPEELKEIIEEKKLNPFKLSYTNTDYLYIVIGYGTQSTGGFSITVDDLYLTEDSIYINTTLLGPEKDEQVEQAETYPYVVIKTEYIDKTVIYE